jgi:hypothetical protein
MGDTSHAQCRVKLVFQVELSSISFSYNRQIEQEGKVYRSGPN